MINGYLSEDASDLAFYMDHIFPRVSTMRPSSYLGPDARPHVPEFPELLHAAVSGMTHPEFTFHARLLELQGEQYSLAIQSETRHHLVAPTKLDGTESMTELFSLALAMVQRALAHDACLRFKFHGSPIFARAGA